MEKCVELIQQSGVPLDTILDLLQQMKMLAAAAPQQAKLMLQQDPKLANAMFQTMLTMGIVKPEALMQQILAIQATAGVPPQPLPVAPQPAIRPTVPAAPVPAPAPMNPYAAAPATAVEAGADDQRAMILRVLALTPEQIAQLPPSEQQAIHLIRQSLGGTA
ncbi:hypothetical protein CALCODRAFT_497807 [Calocera cornea HHB12733]|uniref:Cleavage stimulation factor subunit 2 hinge domain-containing protein n=1 Tax=Calocera cornea HHB12733 TaxID=1353952 RepID=A0A165F3F5_9BASI|nr:hypothetical protein CALCODRAFT_497807 [Calocera cornea HHB12733]